MSDLIDRQIAISAICNACGKIDCDKMDKCEKSQLPPANNSEIPNSSDTISRVKAIEALNQQAKSMSEWSERYEEQRRGVLTAVNIVEDLPPAQPEIIRCKDCRHFKQVFAPNDNDGLCGHWHSKYDARTSREGYCSHAERKEVTT